MIIFYIKWLIFSFWTKKNGTKVYRIRRMVATLKYQLGPRGHRRGPTTFVTMCSARSKEDKVVGYFSLQFQQFGYDQLKFHGPNFVIILLFSALLLFSLATQWSTPFSPSVSIINIMMNNGRNTENLSLNFYGNLRILAYLSFGPTCHARPQYPSNHHHPFHAWPNNPGTEPHHPCPSPNSHEQQNRFHPRMISCSDHHPFFTQIFTITYPSITIASSHETGGSTFLQPRPHGLDI